MVSGHKPWSSDALNLVSKRFLPKGEASVEEWLKTVCARVCDHYPDGERQLWIERFFDLIYSRTFLPTTTTLHNAFWGHGGLSGCMVLPLPSETEKLVGDTLSLILKTLISGTGVGLDFTVLPPRLWQDDASDRMHAGPSRYLYSIAAAAEGPVPYAGVKRPAFMASIMVDHPDVFEFLTTKLREEQPAVNISAAVEGAFLTALRRDGWLPLRWHDGERTVYLTRAMLDGMRARASQRGLPPPDLYVRDDARIYSNAADSFVGREVGDKLFVRAQTLLDVIAETAHRCGDPGLLNLEAINRANPTHPRYGCRPGSEVGVGVMRTTAPCGEQPLLPYEVCQLGSFNLTAFIDRGRFDFRALEQSVHLAVRFLDDVIEVGYDGPAEIDSLAKANRKIGIGIMGLADVLAEMEIPYDTEEARLFGVRVMGTIRENAAEASQLLAKERGAFPSCKCSRFHLEGLPRRNATLTSIAPTGYISTLAECSTGIEPYYLLDYSRAFSGTRRHKCVVLENKLAALGYSLDKWIDATRSERPRYEFDGTLAALSDRPSGDSDLDARLRRLKDVFRTAHEISPSEHLKMVSALQPFVDNGISKTINLHHDATVEDVRRVFEEALGAGVKGVTIFRDRSLDRQALTPSARAASLSSVD